MNEIGKKLKSPNVFKNWSIETEDILDACAKLDFEFWKVPNFVKDKGEIESIKHVIRKYYRFLKEVFSHIASRSLTYPCVSQLECGYLI